MTRRVGADRLARFFAGIREGELGLEDLVFVCIGTDRSTGDSLGPLTGTLLAEAGYRNVVGTLERPCDADTFASRLCELPAGKRVVAVDACLGHPSSVGCFLVGEGSLTPGRSLDKGLPAIGEYKVAAIVAEARGHPYRVLQTASLYRVLTMARQIVRAIAAAYPLQA